MKFLVHIDLSKNQLQNAVIHLLEVAPIGIEGQIYYNSTVGDKKLYIHNGTTWIPVGDITSIVSTTSQLAVTSGTIGEVSLALNIASTVTDGGTGLITSDVLYDYITSGVSSVTAIIGSTGISVNSATGAVTITNTDLGSSQNIFKNFAVLGQNTVVADSNNDTLTFVAGNNITLTTDNLTDAITITSANTVYTPGYGLQEETPNEFSIDTDIVQEVITVTTTGSGAATLDPITHVLNIPDLGYTPVNVAGDIMLGTLTLNADPVEPLEAATKQYVDQIQSGTYAYYTAQINDNKLLPERYYALTDYQHKYYIEETNTSPKKVFKAMTFFVNSGYVALDSEYVYDLAIGTTVTIEYLPPGYTGSLVIGETTTVTDNYFNYYFRFANGMGWDSNNIDVKLSYTLTRFSTLTSLNGATVYDTHGKIELQPGGVLNTDVHDGTAYGDLTAVENFIPLTEVIILKAKSTNSFYESCASLTYLNDEMIYDFTDNIVYNDNQEQIGTRNGFIKRRFNKVLDIDINKDWRVQRYRRWLVPEATITSDYRKKLLNQDYPNTNPQLAFQNNYLFTSELMDVNSTDNMYICTAIEYTTLTAGETGSTTAFTIVMDGTGGLGSTEGIVKFKDYTIFELNSSLEPIEIRKCLINDLKNTIFVNTDATAKTPLNLNITSYIYNSTFFGYPTVGGSATSFNNVNTFDKIEFYGTNNIINSVNILSHVVLYLNDVRVENVITGSLPSYATFSGMGDLSDNTPSRWLYLTSEQSFFKNYLIGVGVSNIDIFNLNVEGGSLFHYGNTIGDYTNEKNKLVVSGSRLLNTNYHSYYSQNYNASDIVLLDAEIKITENITDVTVRTDSNSAFYYQNLDVEVPENTITKNYNFSTYLFETAPSIFGNLVPYTGATSDVDLGVNSITATSFIKDLGVPEQFLKADGSVDNNVYLTSADLPATLVLYATTAADPIIVGYTILVRSISDPRYNVTAVDISTGTITTTAQLIGSLISDASAIAGNPGVFEITTTGNIRKAIGSGSGTADFFFRVYKRDIAGIETFITESAATAIVPNGGVYTEFNATAVWDDGVFLTTDRIVIKYYANRISGGSNPTYEFQFGGIYPVRSLAAVPVAVIPNIYLSNLVDVENIDALDNEVLYWNDTAKLWEHTLIEDIVPDAGVGQRGLLSAGLQTIAGAKNFTGGIDVTTSGSALVLNSSQGTALNVYGGNNGNPIVKFSNIVTTAEIARFDNSGLKLQLETASTIASFDTNKNVVSLKTIDGYPTLNELKQLAGISTLSSIQTQLNSKQANIILTTTGTSGAATLTGATLNIPQYSGATNLDYNPSPTNGTVTSSTGNSAILTLANATNAGLLTPAKFTVLENTSNTNTGDETVTTIKTKLGITTLSGSNTGDQDLSGYALLNSPTFIGTPSLPTGTIGVTQTSSNNSTKIATTAYVDNQVAIGIPLYNITISSFPGNTMTTETPGFVGAASYSQNGRNVMINNGITAITVTLSGASSNFIASYTKIGSANITFLATGVTLVQPNGNVLSGNEGSTALLTKNGSTVYLLINNIF